MHSCSDTVTVLFNHGFGATFLNILDPETHYLDHLDSDFQDKVIGMTPIKPSNKFKWLAIGISLNYNLFNFHIYKDVCGNYFLPLISFLANCNKGNMVRLVDYTAAYFKDKLPQPVFEEDEYYNNARDEDILPDFKMFKDVDMPFPEKTVFDEVA
jgi:hypothetical protein